MKVTFHRNDGPSGDFCFANAGEGPLDSGPGTFWVTRIWTGNNRVQWYGDGKWQPDEPIEKGVPFTFPNHPGGVAVEQIRIL